MLGRILMYGTSFIATALLAYCILHNENNIQNLAWLALIFYGLSALADRPDFKELITYLESKFHMHNTDWEFASLKKSVDSLVEHYAAEKKISKEEALEEVLARVATDLEVSTKKDSVSWQEHLKYPANGM